MSDKIKITKRTVDALKPTGKRYLVSDSQLPGFVVRVSPDGAKSFGFRYRTAGGRSGRQRWMSLGQFGPVTPDEARNMAQRYSSEVAQGGDPAAERDTTKSAPDMSGLLDRFIAEHLPHKKVGTRRETKRLIENYIRPALGRHKVKDVTQNDLMRLHSGMSATPTQANRVLAWLSKIFSQAELWGDRPKGTNPAQGIPKFKETKKDRFLTPDEFRRLATALRDAESGPIDVPERTKPVRINPQVVRAIRLCLLTGARIGEILALRWEHINWREGRLELPDSKTGAKHVPIGATTLEYLNSFMDTNGGHGFVIRGWRGLDPEKPLQNYKDAWATLCKAANLEGLRVHDLRHSFASVGVSSGHSLPMIGQLLGHTETSTTARYAHLHNDPQRAAADQISGHIAALLDTENEGAEVVTLHKKR